MNKIFEQIKSNWNIIIDKLLEKNESFSIQFIEAFIRRPLKLIKYEKNVLYIEVPEEGYVRILKAKLIDTLLKISIAEVLNISLDDINIEFLVKDDNIFTNQEILDKNFIEKKLNNLKIDKNHTFDNFVVGSSNELAYATSIAVAENPGTIVNPLVIYGNTGLGKTHLLHAIAHFSLEKYKNYNIVYVYTQDFITEYITATKNNKIDEVSKKYKSLDMLIIDDIEFLDGKESTQNIFFDIFNTLYDSKKQIILSSDKPIKDLNGIQERLLSRFSCGGSYDIKSPDYETRISILLKKLEELKPEFPVDEEVIKYIALSVKSNIRVLEGCLNKIIQASRLQMKNIDIKYAKELLTDNSEEKDEKITVEKIVRTVSEYLNINKLDICGTKKNKEFVYARDICIYLSRELIKDITQVQIGKYFGRDHSTVNCSCKRVDDNLRKNEILRDDIDNIKERLLI